MAAGRPHAQVLSLALLLVLAAPAARARSGTAPLPSLPYAASQSFSETGAAESYGFPIGPSVDHDAPPLRQIEGRITRRAWQVEATELTSLQLLAPLREALRAEGWQIVLDCEARACGGFDFRFALEVIPAPAMNVDLFDFRTLSAQRDGQWVLVLVSRNGKTGYVQVIHAEPGQITPPPEGTVGDDAPVTLPSENGQSDLVATLRSQGHAPLDDLRFATGEVALEDSPAPSLNALADFLRDSPGARLLLVGHTDSEGPLETNSALSQRRAEAVRQKLISLGVAPDRLEAHGVGYLAPRAANATEEGRRANRRVEAVLMQAP